MMLAAFAAAAAAQVFAEDFERGLCIGRCPGARWAITQQVDGRVEVVPARGGKALRARTEARRGRVPKAALVARPAKLAPGSTLHVSLEMRVPEGAPLNSIHLVDVECATCGHDYNPGIRLYLRHGRLRIDRAKIGEAHAWVNDEAPQLRHGRWHRIDLAVRVGFEGEGAVAVRLDGATVLEARGATIVRPAGRAGPGADRVQIGLTASSNPRPAIAYFDNVRIAITR